MVQKQRSEYLHLRRKFEPTSVTLVIVAESPPTGGKYFYDPDGKVSEPLFDALMKQLGVQPKTKSEGLREFQKRGGVLVDATYEPVNALNKRDRDMVIERDYLELCGDLKRLLAARWREVPLILIKANVCGLLGPKLKENGFNVLNKGRIVYFPANGQRRVFDRQFREIVPQTLRGTEMTPRTPDALGNIQSVRYVKNGKGAQGKGGQWWKAAKESNQVHAGWRELSPEYIVHPDFAKIENLVGLEISDPGARKRDFNALRQLLDTPSRHLWITFEAGDLWWCTVKDRAVPNPNGATDKAGHFWLECDRPWSNYSLEGKRQLVMTEPPGTVIAAAGFRATVCEPKGWQEILRIIRNEEDADARAARHAREAYQDAVAKLRIPRQSGRGFRFDVGHRSDLIPATSPT